MSDANESEISAANAEESPVYLVFGAYGGVGSDLAKRLSQRNARLILAGRDRAKLAQIAEETGAATTVCDVTDFAQMSECVTSARARYDRLDGVANCVGSLLLKPAHLTSEEEWSALIAANLTGAFATVKFAAKAMMGNGGSIVLVSSAAAAIGLPNHEAIAAAKAGVEGLVRSAAATYSRQQVRVNCVAPGMLDTNLTQKITSNETQLQASKDLHALGRIGSPSDVSVVMDWLLGPQSTWVTGQKFTIDGGLSALKALRPQR